MTTYAVFLRGVNLGPTNKVSMPVLREALTTNGFSDVRTYINSGNVLLTSADSPLEVQSRVATVIAEAFGLTIDVTVRTLDQLRAILEANPFPEGDPSKVTVAFLIGSPRPDAEERLAALAGEHEPYVFAGTEIYVHYSHGLGKSKLAEKFSATVGTSATVRNVRTVAKLLDL